MSALLCTTFLYACSNNTASKANTASQSKVTTQSNIKAIGDKNISTAISERVTYDTNDYYSDWKNENPNYIELKGTNAAIFSKGNLTINGTGKLTVRGNYNNGIPAKEI